MEPTIGRIVHYQLTYDNALAISRRRKNAAGAQTTVGNAQSVGDVVPLVVVRVWPDEYGPGIPGVNGQALLDGNDQLWVTSAGEGDQPGQWVWPPRV